METEGYVHTRLAKYENKVDKPEYMTQVLFLTCICVYAVFKHESRDTWFDWCFDAKALQKGRSASVNT